MIAKYLTNNDFLNKYIENYALRQAIANMQLENKENEMISSLGGYDEMYDNIEAFKWIINESPKIISPHDLNEISYRVNGGIYNKGYRKTHVDVVKAKNFVPISPKNIPQAMYSLFDSYKNIWLDLPTYEKEARLHIEIVRIQPYEDGNKRSARILTSYNLCLNNKAPIIIPGSDTDEYFGYIDNYDVDGMSKYFEKRSKLEFEYLLEYYYKLCGGTFDLQDIDKVDDQGVKIYNLKRTRNYNN